MTNFSTKRKFPSLVYNTSRWQEALFDKRRTTVPRLATAMAVTGKALDLGDDQAENAGGLGLEVFSRLYDSPEKLETANPETPWAEAVHGMLDEMAEFKDLSSLTASDPDMAALATAEMLAAIEPRLGDLVKQSKQPEPTQGDDQTGRQGFSLTAADKVRALLRGAAREARQAVQEAKSQLDGIMPGLGGAPAVHEQTDGRRAALADALAHNKNLRKIIDLAGRLQRIAAQTKKQRNPDLREEVVDIERGGDLGRILPSELSGLRASSRALRLLTLGKIAERTTLQYRLDGKEPQGRGHMVVALDESGSMSYGSGGSEPNNVWARAIGLACLRVARQERRSVTIVGFNGGLTSRHLLDKAGACWRWDGSAWKPMEGGFVALAMEVISRGCSGGTSFDAPIAFAIDTIEQSGDERPDLLFVTDGEAMVSPAIMARLAEAKRAKGLRVFGVVMAHGNIPQVVRDVCDEAINFTPDVATVAKVIPG